MSITAESVLDRLDLDRLLNDSQFEWDLRQGVIFNPAKTRLCLFSADLLSGVYKALLDEAGEAWSLIFKRCGQIWGGRLARRLYRQRQRRCRCIHDVPGAVSRQPQKYDDEEY